MGSHANEPNPDIAGDEFAYPQADWDFRNQYR